MNLINREKDNILSIAKSLRPLKDLYSKQNKDFMMKTKLQAENAGKNFELTCSVKTDGNSAVFMPELTNIAKGKTTARYRYKH